jgi:outer membrane protein OmpU
MSGAAAAEVTWSGAAGAGIFSGAATNVILNDVCSTADLDDIEDFEDLEDLDCTDPDDQGYDGSGIGMYNFINLTATLSGQTDNGLSFGGSVSIDVGRDFDTGDFEFDGNEDGTASFDSLFISGEFGTVTFDFNGLDNLYNDDFDAHDIMYEYDVSGFSVALTFDVQDSGVDGEHWSVKLGYAMDGLAASLATDDSNEVNIELAYDVLPVLTVALGHDTRAGEAHSGNAYSTDLSVDYDDGTISAGLMIDTDQNYELSLGYAMDGLALGAVVFGDESANETDYTITGSYDLGGGMSLVGGYDNDKSHNADAVWYLGATMAF